MDGLAGEAVIRTGDDQDWIAVEELGAQCAIEGRLERAGEADVDASDFEGGDLLVGVHFDKGELYAGVAAAELADDAREKTA